MLHLTTSEWLSGGMLRPLVWGSSSVSGFGLERLDSVRLSRLLAAGTSSGRFYVRRASNS